MTDEVKTFVKRFDVLAIAMSWMVGFTCKDMLLAFLDGVAYPLLEVIIPKQWWNALVFEYNGVVFDIANIIFRTIDFVIAFGIMFVIVMVILPRGYSKK